MKRDVVITFILSAFSAIAALVCLAIVMAENFKKANRNFTISEEDIISTAGYLTLFFGFAAILSLIIGLIMNFNDKVFEASWKE